ncbi:MoxR family ATPase [Geobacter sp. OR-1]|uniref:AAA family ATPase n=1 Tax=Geobacter sp. OR-1 TaxID=1266765 RepID=UPI0005AA6063|nr:MoxR family ATPase [Geobacter sp. OR-1]
MSDTIDTNSDQTCREIEFIPKLIAAMESVIVGQKALVERLLVALLANGHILIEGVPGLAKTTVVKTLAGLIDARFQRIQFTPDLLPADLVGTQIYNPRDGHFSTRKGPIFANIVLADEVNRAPAKVHSALLEAMEERQVTIGESTYPLDELFMVLATQNPIEQEGTYPLPEAQMDRFMLKISLDYPSWGEEREIIRRAGHTARNKEMEPVLHPADILRARSAVDALYLDEKIEQYILDIVFATRDPSRCGLERLSRYIEFGASPRGSIYMAIAAKSLAFIRGRSFVTPQDIKDIAPDILRHRIITSYEADIDGMTTGSLVAEILANVRVP